MNSRRIPFVCPDINCYAAALSPHQIGHGLDYYKGRTTMSGYGLGSWFARLFRSALPLAKKYIVPAATNFAGSTLQDWSSGKNFKDSLKENLRSSARAVGEQLKSQQNGKGLKRMRGSHSLISLHPGEKRKPSSTTTILKRKSIKKKKKKKIVRSKQDFFS
jgi:hypothetical protein